MPTPKTDKEIGEQIQELARIKPTVLRFSKFGNDHHKAIDAQIKALSERMTEENVCDKWPNAEHEDDGQDENQRTAALEAVNWMNGYESQSPSENWSPLIQNPSPAPVPAKKKRTK